MTKRAIGPDGNVVRTVSTKHQTVSAKSVSLFPNTNRRVQKRREGFLQFAVEYIINDIKSLIHKDKKSQEDKMKYEEFMERFGK